MHSWATATRLAAIWAGSRRAIFDLAQICQKVWDFATGFVFMQFSVALHFLCESESCCLLFLCVGNSSTLTSMVPLEEDGGYSET